MSACKCSFVKLSSTISLAASLHVSFRTGERRLMLGHVRDMMATNSLLYAPCTTSTITTTYTSLQSPATSTRPGRPGRELGGLNGQAMLGILRVGNYWRNNAGCCQKKARKWMEQTLLLEQKKRSGCLERMQPIPHWYSVCAQLPGRLKPPWWWGAPVCFWVINTKTVIVFISFFQLSSLASPPNCFHFLTLISLSDAALNKSVIHWASKT